MSSTIETPVPAAPVKDRRYTYDELVAEMPETNLPCELWEGQLIMSPAPSFYHQETSLRFYRLLFDWVSPRKLGKVIASPIDMVLSPHRTVQPDVAFITQERLAIVQSVIRGPADLVAEVVSLGGRNRDRIEKRDLYEQHGIKEYWIIDPEPETVDLLSLMNSRYDLVTRGGPGQAVASRLLPGFEISVDHLFRDV